MTQRTLLFTGATGFVGRHALRHLLMRAPNTRVIALLRGKNIASARARLIEALEEAAHDAGELWDPQVLAQLEVWLGDVTLPLCGVTPTTAAVPALEVFHFAASLCFEDHQRELLQQQNVDGSLHVVELAAALGARRFVHVSTAYSCGREQGVIAERLHAGSQGFHNAYEQSKHEAEHRVSERCADLSIDCRIVRPSIVVGSLRTHSPSGSDTGMYGFIREMLRVRGILRGLSGPVRLAGDRDAKLNLVPVDAVARELYALWQQDFPRGPVYHLASDACPTVGATLDAICDAIGVPHFDVRPSLDGPLSAVEGVFAKRTKFYGSYLGGARTFARSACEPVTVTDADVELLAQRFVDAAREKRSMLSGQWLRARDGMPLRVHSSASTRVETVVLVNAFGMPALAFEELAHELAPHARLLCLSSRGCPELAGELDARSARFEHHVDDLEDLLDAHAVESAHLIGYCTGADVAMRFATRSPQRVKSLSLLHGAFAGVSQARTAFSTSLETIVRRVARSPDAATSFHALIADVLSPYFSCASTAKDRALLETTVGQLDSSLFHLTSAPFRSPEALHRYALLMRAYFDEPPTAIPRLCIPSLVVTADDDTVAHPEGSELVARALGNAQLLRAADGAHFSLCRSAQVIGAVRDLILGQLEQRGQTAA